MYLASSIDPVSESLPNLNFSEICKAKLPLYRPKADIKVVSVEVLYIDKNSATALALVTNIFHDTESLVVIERIKSKSTGLVSTNLWNWTGSCHEPNAKEERKLQDLETRFSGAMVGNSYYLRLKFL